MILAADIGGTNARLLLGKVTAQGWQTVRQQVFASRDYPTFDTLLQRFLLPDDRIRATCLAVAGPVVQQQVRITHLPWQLDAAALAQRHPIGPVELINDFVAQAYGLPLLSADDLLTLQAGAPGSVGDQLLIGAGTGLGIATRVACGQHIHVIASEGGHADFAPHGAGQVALHAALLGRLGRVSIEAVLSGPGLENIHGYLRADTAADAGTPRLSAAGISAAALQGDVVAMQAMTLFLDIYGATAGNLALTNLPYGGVYITGGIAPRIVSCFNQGPFLAAFCDKPPKRELLQRLPVHVVLNDQLGLLGAAAHAAAAVRGF